MRNSVLFGNGINRISDSAVSWDDLLIKIKGANTFENGDLPNTMVYERIYLENQNAEEALKKSEFQIKELIAKAMEGQGSNDIFELLSKMNIENYLTTNYDYAFEKTLSSAPEKLSTEDVYSLRRKRKYSTPLGEKYLWSIHGEIEHPKSIMLGLDHYCGSVSKIDSYVKGGYKHTIEGKTTRVIQMSKKIETNSYCYTSWVDLFFASNMHIIGLGLDYSETDIWWLLNKRARLSEEINVKNKVYYYTNSIEPEKKELLESFNVNVVTTTVSDNDYKRMYKSVLKKIKAK